MLKPLTVFPIAIAIATGGCNKETTKEPVITSEYEMKCEQVYKDYIINVHRCENKETICYKTTKGISCLKKD